MNLTLFSLEEANQLTKELAPEVQLLAQAERERSLIGTQVAALSLAVAGADATNPDAIELERLRDRAAVLERRISEGMHRIHDRGAVVKDLARGLLDFYALAGDRLIFLCWQLGEAEISHWHTLEGGFSGRQPLSSTGLD